MRQPSPLSKIEPPAGKRQEQRASVSLKQGAGVATPSHAARGAASKPARSARASSTVIPRCSRSARMAPTPRSAPFSITIRASRSCIAQSFDCCSAKPPRVAGETKPGKRSLVPSSWRRPLIGLVLDAPPSRMQRVRSRMPGSTRQGIVAVLKTCRVARGSPPGHPPTDHCRTSQ